jgi:hypothetical protein
MNILRFISSEEIESVGRFTECNFPHAIRCFVNGLPDHPSPTFQVKHSGMPFKTHRNNVEERIRGEAKDFQMSVVSICLLIV